MKRLLLNSILCMLVVVSFASCKQLKEYTLKDITDIKEEYPIEIQATFNDEYDGSCRITEPEVIKQIMDILHARTYEYTRLSPSPGTNRALTLKYASGEQIRFSTRCIGDGKGGYYCPSERDDLDNIIRRYGIDAGTVVPR